LRFYGAARIVGGMQALRAIAISGLLATACTSSNKKGSPIDASVVDVAVVDASIAGEADAYVKPAAWPMPDAPPSTCSPDAGCGDAGVCWQHVGGNHVCASFALPPPSSAPGQVCDGGVVGGARPGLGTCCLRHADCPGGRCVDNGYRWGGGMPPPPGSHCAYDSCRDDSGCPPGSWCFPAEWAGDDAPHCIHAPCRKNADCNKGPGGACIWSYERIPCTGNSRVVVHCQYTNDVCRSNLDCPVDAGLFGGCVLAEDGHGTRCAAAAPVGHQCPP
jgi:hypothetical protein